MGPEKSASIWQHPQNRTAEAGCDSRRWPVGVEPARTQGEEGRERHSHPRSHHRHPAQARRRGRERHHYAEHPRVGGFRAAYVFDVSQTDGESLPELREISGDVGDNHELLRAFVEGRGIELVFTENIAGALGVSYGGRVGANISDIQIRYASLVAATGVNGIGMILRNSAHALREARRGARQLSS
jgi:hypothetical protein